MEPTTPLIQIRPNTEVVWAKVKGYSWWPAIVQAKERQENPNRIRAQFFGENCHAYVSKNTIKDFLANYDQLAETKNKKLKRSIELALAYHNHLPRSPGSTASRLENQSLLDASSHKQHQEDIHRAHEIQYSTSSSNNHPVAGAGCEAVLPMLDQNIASNVESSAGLILQSQQIQQMEVLQYKGISSDEEEDEKLERSSERNPRRFKLISKPAKGECPSKKTEGEQNQKTNSRRSKQYQSVIVPYRKFQEARYQMKIVELINKIHSRKNCSNDLQKLISKLPQMGPKVFMNRYVVSGLITITKIYRSTTNTELDLQLIEKLDQHLRDIFISVKNRLSDTSLVEAELTSKIGEAMCEEPQSDTKEEEECYKKNVIKMIYRLLKRVKSTEGCYDNMREASIGIYNKLEESIRKRKCKPIRAVLRQLTEDTERLELASSQSMLEQLLLASSREVKSY